jgi:hypothetical protein
MPSAAVNDEQVIKQVLRLSDAFFKNKNLSIKPKTELRSITVPKLQISRYS